MTDTITLPRTEAESVLLALEDSKTFDDGAAKWDRLTKSINIVRAALAQQAEPLVTYRHKDGTQRFAQYAKDPIPVWAVDVQSVAQQAEQGWVWVPVEPTQEMITAGRTTPMPSDSEFDEDEDYRAVFIAMVAAAPKGGGWQPIATAPKDGKWALVYADEAVNCAFVKQGALPKDWCGATMWNINPSQVTHWMSLPAAPKGEV